MNLQLSAAALVLLAVASASFAKEPQPISFRSLTNPDGQKSALSGECTGTTASDEIVCTFTQVMVSHVVDPADLPVKLAEARRDWAKEKATELDQIKEGCAELVSEQYRVELAKLPEPDKSRAERAIKLCEDPTEEKMWSFIEQGIREEARTCRVWTHSNGPYTFRRIAANRWLSNEGPTGICNVVNVMVLEHEPEYPNLWTYTQTRTYADKEGELCSAIELNKPLVFDWRDHTLSMQCDFISFGMF